VKEWKETHLLPAIEKLKETMQKQGYIQIPWTDEQRIFPIPVSATEGHKVIIESSYGTEKPKMPEFIQLLLKGASPSVKT
jgi:hypothetical protein